MSKECEYRAYAGACVDLANKATNDDDRKHLLAMAEAWLGLVDRSQRPADEPDADFVASCASGKARRTSSLTDAHILRSTRKSSCSRFHDQPPGAAAALALLL